MRFTIATLLSLVTFVSAAPTVLKRQNGLQVISSCSVDGQIALTFDDGPYIYENDVVNDLNGGKGTFFLNGNNYVCIYDKYQTVRDLHAAGHTLGSHTWSHAHLTQLDYNGISQELEKVEDAFVKILGLKPLYFRPPYGEYNDLVLQVLGDRGYKKVFLWSDDTGDANGESVEYSINVYNDVINSYPQPHIVLDHSVIETTSSQLLPNVVPRLQQAGYQIVAVDTCLGSNGEWPYEYVSEPGQPDGSWTC